MYFLYVYCDQKEWEKKAEKCFFLPFLLSCKKKTLSLQT